MKLLLVEDNPTMQTTLQRSLSRRGMEVATCGDGGLALEKWPAFQPDVVVLDLTLPGLDGLQVTARGTVGDRIIGLNTGADDYLPKPFDLDELEARVRALARRAGVRPPAGDDPGASVSLGSLRHDRHSGAIYCRDEVLDLAPRELALLQALMARPGHAVSKEHLFEQVFPGAEDVQYEAIEVVAYRLRKKLAHSGVMLVTLRGLGYLLKVAT